jgi:hypothetical protein
MKARDSLLGLWVVRTNDPAPSNILLARVQDELYVLAFSSAPRAIACCRALGAEGQPFYVVGANLSQVTHAARSAGATGFIVDYDAARATFSSAHLLGEPPSSGAERSG